MITQNKVDFECRYETNYVHTGRLMSKMRYPLGTPVWVQLYTTKLVDNIYRFYHRKSALRHSIQSNLVGLKDILMT